MKKKAIACLILGALAAGLLVGCGDTATTASQPQTESSAPSTVESTTESSEPVSSAVEIPSTEMLLDEKEGDNVGQFVLVSGATNAAIDEINTEMADLVRDYKAGTIQDDGSWVEYRTYTNQDSGYLNIVVHHNTYPTYGNQGELDTFVYDIQNAKLLSVEDVLSMTGKTESAIESAFASYYATAAESNQYRQITDFDIEGCAAYENGQADIYLLVETENTDDAPAEYQTSASKELYVFHTDDAGFSMVNFDNNGLFANDGRQIF